MSTGNIDTSGMIHDFKLIAEIETIEIKKNRAIFAPTIKFIKED